MMASEVQQLTFRMTREEFDFFREKIFLLAGISLSDAKLDLLQARLRSRVLSLGMKDFKSYQLYLQKLPEVHQEWEHFINLLTTNKTDWFREPDHFSFIVNEFLPRWFKLGKKHLKVWCAACSTGEEAYTLSLVLNLALKTAGVSFDILATDIDTNVLGLGKNGVYPQSCLPQIPEKYHFGFCQGTKELSSWMKVRKEVKAPVEFKHFNLSQIPYHWPEKFDLVLCRNVMIYFNKETIRNVVEAIYESSCDDAALIIAHSESLQNVNASWKYLAPSLYHKGRLF